MDSGSSASCLEPSGGDQHLELKHWHRNDPAPLTGALARAYKAAPRLDTLARFLLPRVPRWILCSSNLKNVEGKRNSRRRRLDKAISCRWVAFNNQHWFNTETADCDDTTWPDKLDSLVRFGLPEPTFVVVSPWKGTAHLVWVYEPAIRRADSDQANLRSGIRQGLVSVFGADPNFQNLLQKNPWHRRRGPGVEQDVSTPGLPAVWDAYVASKHSQTYVTHVQRIPRAVAPPELFAPLAAYAAEQGVLLQRSPRRSRNGTSRVHLTPKPFLAAQRGTRLFDTARQRVYRAQTADEDAIRPIVLRTAAELGSPASPREIDGMVTRLAEFMRTRWRGRLDGRAASAGSPVAAGTRDIDGGVMTREAEADGQIDAWLKFDVAERQAAAGRRSGALSRQRGEVAIDRAVAALTVSGETVTQKAVAALAKVSLSTVKRRWGRVLEGVNRSNPFFRGGRGGEFGMNRR